MKTKLLLVGVFLLVLFPLFSTRVSADNPVTVGANLAAYIQQTGSDCDINVPTQYTTIQAAINAANSGDTVCVGAGTYNENVIINKSIRLSGGGAARSVINGQITQDFPGFYTLYVTANNVIAEGFLIKGVGDADDATVLLPGDSRSGATIQYNWIVSGNNELALRADGYQTNEIIQNNIFEGKNSPYIAWTGGGEGINFLNNTFIGTVGQNWVLENNASNSMIKQNAFNTSGGRAVIRASSTNVINENNFSSDPNLKVDSSSSGTLNAENNWWGDTDPSDNFSGDVDFIPFALSPFPEYPVPVLPTNHPPTITSISPISSVLPDTQINASATFTDADVTDIHTATWGWGDGNTTISNVAESNGSGTVTGNHAYALPGTYTVTLTVSDGIDTASTNTSVIILTPIQAINNTVDFVQTYNLQQGISNSLDVKLSTAIDSLNDLNNQNNVAAINSLQAFINAVSAQSGNKLIATQADTLISQANALIAYLTH